MVNTGNSFLAAALLALDFPVCDFPQKMRVRFSKLSATEFLRLRVAADNRTGFSNHFLFEQPVISVNEGQIFCKAIGEISFGITVPVHGNWAVRRGRVAFSCCWLRPQCCSRFRRGPLCRRALICRCPMLLNRKTPPAPPRPQPRPVQRATPPNPRPRQPEHCLQAPAHNPERNPSPARPSRRSTGICGSPMDRR